MTPLHSLLPPWGTAAGEIARLALVGAAFFTILAAAELWQRRWAPPAEWTRKFVHFAGGVVVAVFPWAFSTHWTVLLLGATMFATFMAARRAGLLSSVTAVERRSAGELWYPVGVYVLFVIARHQPVFWLIALSSLVVSDTAAALFGARYGRITYFASTDRKSLEGSAAFFVTTWLGVHLTLLLLTDIGRGASVLIGLQLALIVTSFEGISLRGNDNLVVPLATYYLLVKMTPRPPGWIALQLAAELAILAIALLVAWRTRVLSASGAIAAHLVIYAAYALGGPAWSVAPALALAGFVALDVRSGREAGGYQVQAVFWVSIVGVTLLFLDNTFSTLLEARPFGPGHPLVVPYVGALAAAAAIVAYQWLRMRRAAWSRMATVGCAAAAGWALVAPLGLAAVRRGSDARALGVSAGMCLTAVPVYLLARRQLRRRADPRDFQLQAFAVGVAAVAFGILHLARAR